MIADSRARDQGLTASLNPVTQSVQRMMRENGTVICLEHAQHNRADEDERRISGHDAQGSDDGHGCPPLAQRWVSNAEATKTFPVPKRQGRCRITG